MKANVFKKVAVTSSLTVGLSLVTLQSVIPLNVFSERLTTIAFASSENVLELNFENSVEDISPNMIKAEVFGNPEYENGRIGQAITFKKAGQYIDLGDREEFLFGENKDFSISFWIKSNRIQGDPAIISNKNWNSGSNTGWILALNGAGDLIWNYKTSNSNRLDYRMPKVGDNTWHHIAITHDRKNGKAHFYKDGALVHTVDISYMKGTLDSTYTTKIAQDGTGKYSSSLTATLDELQISTGVLTQQEVQQMFNDAPPLELPKVESIILDQTNLEIKSGAPMPLVTTINPIDASNQELKWTSSDEEVARIEEIADRPTIIGGTPGEATITVSTKDGLVTAAAKVKVINSTDVNGDGLLSEEDLKFILQNQNSRKGDTRWRTAQKADINNDQKVNQIDIYLMNEMLAPYKNDFLYKRVLFIGIDGAGNSVKDQEANARNIKKLINEGAVTYEAKAMLPTISAENWGAMFHGVEPSKHKLTNDIVGSNYYPENNPYPSFMKILKQERPNAQQASFATWSPINKGIIEDSSGALKVNGGNDATTTQKTIDYIKANGKNTRSLFVHFDEVDGAGHSFGYYSDKFYEKMGKTDQYIGQIIETLDQEGLTDDTLIIITADHGGTSSGSHGGSSEKEQTIFWTAKGASIKPGTILSDDVRNMDTAAVIARALRLNTPANWDAKIPTGLFQKQN